MNVDYKLVSVIPSYERMINSMSELMCLVDESSRIIMANSSLTRVTGAKNGDECPIKGLHCDCGIGEECSILKRKKYEVFTISRNGRIYQISTAPMLQDNGEFKYLLQTWRDITGEVHLKSKITTQNQHMKKDLEVARRLQNSMLLDTFPDIKNVKFSSIYLPCESIGGDFYDVFKISEDKVVFYIADVSGHGVSAAMITVFFAQTVKSIMSSTSFDMMPNEILGEVWKRFIELGLEEYFYVTAWMGILDSSNNKLTYCNAGHIASPIIVNKDHYMTLEMPGFPICRWIDRFDNKNETIIMKKKTRLLLYTDGLSDAWRLNEDTRGDFEITHTPDMIAIKHVQHDEFSVCLDNIWNDISEGIDEEKLDDDIAMLLIECS